ncbi:hypothetical protein ACFV0R_28945 [Streptomyces sp. NPDC059578]|uniref:hypothetical protein n=1 Tax=Streptomyces sp. NPDC059578 TaxID=3346874 RepID=UPI0036BED077
MPAAVRMPTEQHVVPMGCVPKPAPGSCHSNGTECSVDDIRKMVTRLLEEHSFRRGAVSLRREMHAAPSPHDVVPILERMAVHRRRHDAAK